VLGIASIPDPVVRGDTPFPSQFSGAAALFDRRFNCTGGPVLVRKMSTGVFDVKFADNNGRTILASTSGTSGGVVGWSRQGDGSFRLSIAVGTGSSASPVDAPFVVILF
jgi:hypothetical protein